MIVEFNVEIYYGLVILNTILSNNNKKIVALQIYSLFLIKNHTKIYIFIVHKIKNLFEKIKYIDEYFQLIPSVEVSVVFVPPRNNTFVIRKAL